MQLPLKWTLPPRSCSWVSLRVAIQSLNAYAPFPRAISQKLYWFPCWQQVAFIFDLGFWCVCFYLFYSLRGWEGCWKDWQEHLKITVVNGLQCSLVASIKCRRSVILFLANTSETRRVLRISSWLLSLMGDDASTMGRKCLKWSIYECFKEYGHSFLGWNAAFLGTL